MLFGGLSRVLFTDNVPVLNEAACLNRRNRFQPCGLCEDACEFHALSMSAGLPVVDERRCEACGVCACVCPSEALRLRDYKIFRDFVGNDAVRCMKSGGNFCLRSLSPALISAAFVVNPAVRLVMPCENCGLSEKISASNLDTASSFLDALNIAHDVNIVRDSSFEDEYSRRDMLAMMFSRGKRSGSNLLEDVIFHDKNDIFLARMFLADRLSEASGEILPGVFYDFSVSEACDACGMCEAMCPSGAWNVAKYDGKAELMFDTVSCSGCMLCVRQCPKNAIILREKFSWPITSTVKAEFRRLRCRHCGAWFVVNEPGQELCCSCSGKK